MNSLAPLKQKRQKIELIDFSYEQISALMQKELERVRKSERKRFDVHLMNELRHSIITTQSNQLN